MKQTIQDQIHGRTIPELLRMRFARMQAAETLMDSAESEARSFTPEEMRTFDRLKSETEAIQAAIVEERKRSSCGGAQQVQTYHPGAQEPRY